MKNLLMIILISILSIGLVYGETITPFKDANLLSHPNKYFSSIPVYNQEGGTCYSYVTSMLLDYERLSKKEIISSEQNLSSTFWIAIKHKSSFYAKLTGESKTPDKTLNSGNLYFSLDGLRNKGTCTNKEVDAILKRKIPHLFKLKNTFNHKDAITLIMNILNSYQNLYYEAKDLMDQGKSFEKEKPNFKLNSLHNVYFSPRPAFVFKTPKVIVPAVKAESNTQATVVAAPTSQPKPAVIRKYEMPKMDLTAYRDNTDIDHEKELLFKSMLADEYAYNILKKAILDEFDAETLELFEILLDQVRTQGTLEFLAGLIEDCQKMPKRFNPKKIGIIYLSLKGKEGTFQFINSQLNTARPRPLGISYCSEMLIDGKKHTSKDANCGSHLSVIVGQRLNAGRKEFLIQNTWGKSCTGISPKWECLKDQGAIWVDGGILFESGTTISWVE